jgi:hypothetical protein
MSLYDLRWLNKRNIMKIRNRPIFYKPNKYWTIAPCSLLKVRWRFGGTYRLYLQGRISRTRYKRENRLLARLIGSCRRRRHVPPKHRLTFNGLHGGISQTIVLFITTAVRNSDRRSKRCHFLFMRPDDMGCLADRAGSRWTKAKHIIQCITASFSITH